MTESSEKDFSQPQRGEHQIRDIEVSSEKWQVFVSDAGDFRAHHLLHGSVSGTSRDEVIERARKAAATGRVKVDVPYARLARTRDGHQIVHGTGTGVHGGSGNVMVREGNESSQASGYRNEKFMPPTPEDAAEMIRLADDRDKAQKDLDALTGKYYFGGSSYGFETAVKEAVQAARRGKGDGA